MRALRSFVTVAEELHFTRAAARLHIAQPSLSHQIRELERELGVLLLVRTKRTVRLTEAGRRFLDRARHLVDDAEAAQLEAQRAARGEVGQLVVGFTPAARDLVPATVRAYRRTAPGVDVVLLQIDPRTQIEALSRDEIQLALIHDRVPGPHFASELLRKQAIVAVLASDHPLATKASVTLGELRNEQFIIGPRSADHDSTDHARAVMAASARAGFIPSGKNQANDLATRIAMVAAGMGVTMVADSSRRVESHDVAYLQLEPPLCVELVAVWRKEPPSPLLSAFLNVLREQVR